MNLSRISWWSLCASLALVLLTGCVPEEVGKASVTVGDEGTAVMTLTVNTCGNEADAVYFDLGDDEGWLADTVVLQLQESLDEQFSVDVTSEIRGLLESQSTSSPQEYIRIIVSKLNDPNENIAHVDINVEELRAISSKQYFGSSPELVEAPC